MVWESATKESEILVKKTISNSMNFKAQRAGKDDGVKNLVGISAPLSKNAVIEIEKYVKRIQEHIDKFDTEVATNTAFKGEDVSRAVKDYLTKVKEECNNLISSLLVFSDKLISVNKKWIEAQAAMATNIDSSKSSFSSNGEYSRQYSENDLGVNTGGNGQ